MWSCRLIALISDALSTGLGFGPAFLCFRPIDERGMDTAYVTGTKVGRGVRQVPGGAPLGGGVVSCGISGEGIKRAACGDPSCRRPGGPTLVVGCRRSCRYPAVLPLTGMRVAELAPYSRLHPRRPSFRASATASRQGFARPAADLDTYAPPLQAAPMGVMPQLWCPPTCWGRCSRRMPTRECPVAPDMRATPAALLPASGCRSPGTGTRCGRLRES